MANLNVFSPPPKTMSSREIAELTGKELAHVHRDIRAMLDDLKKDDPNLDHPREDLDARGYTVCFHLDRELTDTLLTGYSAVLRRKVIARWHELESGQPSKPQITESTKDVLEAVEAFANLLRLEGTSRIAFVGTVLNDKAPSWVAYLPAYATNAPRTTDGKLLGGEGNSMPAFAASALLKKFNSPMSIHAFNKAAEDFGVLETQERPSSKSSDVKRKFKAVSAAGLRYGYNLSNEHSKGAVQPVWFQHKFEDLLAEMTG